MFLDRYHLNLLSVPREGSRVGDLYVSENGRVFAPGNVTRLLEPALEMPEVKTERMADLAGSLSSAVSADVGLGLLGSFMTALGAGTVLEKLRVAYAAKGVRTLKFRFSDATRDWVDMLDLGERLIDHKLSSTHPFVSEEHRYYLVTSVSRTTSISVTAQADRESGPGVEIGAAQFGDLDASVKVQSSATGELTFAGIRTLAFGVELYELVYVPKKGQLKLKLPEGAIAVRATPRAEPLAKPVFIGGDDADIFLRLE
jgi:hypothetical protein